MDWVNRLEEELRTSVNAHFITLTYEDRYCPQTYFGETLCKKDVQNFIKRLRKKCEPGIKYFLVGEYGSKTERPHYHAIIFNIIPRSGSISDVIGNAWSIYNSNNRTYRKIGMVHFGNVTIKSISYTAKYVMQLNRKYEEKERPFSLISKGLGKEYIERNGSFHEGNIEHLYFPKEGGKRTALPRYYKEKLYTKEERKRFENRMRARSDKDYMEKQERYEKNHSDKYFTKVFEEQRGFERKTEKRSKNSKF